MVAGLPVFLLVLFAIVALPSNLRPGEKQVVQCKIARRVKIFTAPEARIHTNLHKLGIRAELFFASVRTIRSVLYRLSYRTRHDFPLH